MLADADRKTVALYCSDVPAGFPGPVPLPPGEYLGRWFDPRTGKWSEPFPVSGEWPVAQHFPWATLLVRK